MTAFKVETCDWYVDAIVGRVRCGSYAQYEALAHPLVSGPRRTTLCLEHANAAKECGMRAELIMRGKPA